MTNFSYSMRLTAQRASDNQECLPAFLEHVVLRILRSKGKFYFTSSCDVQTAIKLSDKYPVHCRAATQVQGVTWIHFTPLSLHRTIAPYTTSCIMHSGIPESPCDQKTSSAPSIQIRPACVFSSSHSFKGMHVNVRRISQPNGFCS